MHRILLSSLPVRSGGYTGEGAVTVVDHSDVIGRFAMVRQAIMSGARACSGRFLGALHESRRTQAPIERARYRHLIHEADASDHFGARPAGIPHA